MKEDNTKVYKIPIFCDSPTGKVKKNLLVGYPNSENNPVFFQDKFLTQKNIKVPEEILDSFQTIYKIAKENNLDFLEIFKATVEGKFEKNNDNQDE